MSAVLESQVHVRTMSLEDIEQVLEVERAAYDFPWTANVFSECLKAGYVCRVCIYDGVIVGYGIMSMGAGECHIMNLCVEPGRHGNGYGSLLMNDLLDIAGQARTRMAFLEVRISNRRAHALYQHLGFNEIGIRKSYYPARRGREDAYVLAKTLD
jgi:ribosomal-protein-alanine N-acetyltransferase